VRLLDDRSEGSTAEVRFERLVVGDAVRLDASGDNVARFARINELVETEMQRLTPLLLNSMLGGGLGRVEDMDPHATSAIAVSFRRDLFDRLRVHLIRVPETPSD